MPPQRIDSRLYLPAQCGRGMVGKKTQKACWQPPSQRRCGIAWGVARGPHCEMRVPPPWREWARGARVPRSFPLHCTHPPHPARPPKLAHGQALFHSVPRLLRFRIRNRLPRATGRRSALADGRHLGQSGSCACEADLQQAAGQLRWCLGFLTTAGPLALPPPLCLALRAARRRRGLDARRLCPRVGVQLAQLV